MPELPIIPTPMPVKKTVTWEPVKEEKKPDPKPNLWRALWIGVLIGIEIIIHLYLLFPTFVKTLAAFIGSIIDP